MVVKLIILCDDHCLSHIVSCFVELEVINLSIGLEQQGLLIYISMLFIVFEKCVYFIYDQNAKYLDVERNSALIQNSLLD